MALIHNSKFGQSKLQKTKNREYIAPMKKIAKKHIFAHEKTRYTLLRPKMVEKLHHSSRRLFTRANLRRKNFYSKQTK